MQMVFCLIVWSLLFTYYLGYEKGKPLYFNQVPVPAFWEISGNNQSARIGDMTQERASSFIMLMGMQAAWLNR